MRALVGCLAWLPLLAFAQQADPVVVTATRIGQPSLEVPASIDRLYGEELREGRAQVNLSESLGRVPGIVVLNRQNYAQDLQISSRGFGARASFGVRGYMNYNVRWAIGPPYAAFTAAGPAREISSRST